MILKALTWLKMFIMSRFFVIYLIIFGYTYTLPTNHDGTTTSSLERQVESEMSPFNQIIQFLKNPPSEELSTKLLDLGKQLQIKLEMLLRSKLEMSAKADKMFRELMTDFRKDFSNVSTIKGNLETEQKITNENILLNIWRVLIDDYEESFPHENDDDFEEKKVEYDKTKFKNLGKDELIEESRRQKWFHYCNKPPNKRMTDLVDMLKKKNVDLDMFSRGIAHAYRLLSENFHTGPYKLLKGDPIKLFMFKEVVIAMKLLLKNEGMLDEYQN